VKNQIFKAQVAALFEKTALQDPYSVALHANPRLQDKIHRGLGLERSFSEAAAGLHLGGRVAGGILTSGASPTGILARTLGGVSSTVQEHPGAVLTAAALSPILYKAFGQTQAKNQDELMRAYHDPMEVVASLDAFLEKKASDFLSSLSSLSKMLGGSAVKDTLSSTFRGGLAKGFGDAVGKGVVAAAIQGIGSHITNTQNSMVDNPKRQAMLATLFKSDPVLSDSIARHPDSKAMLLEAYGTMTKFAPTLSLDINAARSFLREAVLGGAGVNYATIKSMVDTEKAITEAKPRYGGK